MANMFLAGYFLHKAFGYFEDSEPEKGAIYIGITILNIVLGLAINYGG
jgi:hypothetical protein